MRLKTAKQDDLDLFFEYLDQHLKDNGRDGRLLFQPLSERESRVSEGLISKFTDGISKSPGESGWRKLWLAFDNEQRIIGHIDIRHLPESHTVHRVMLGMGVSSASLREGVGESMLRSVIDYCTSSDQIQWLDLWVLSGNSPAIKLYEKCGFHRLGEVPDMFRIDNQSYDYTHMTLQTGEVA